VEALMAAAATLREAPAGARMRPGEAPSGARKRQPFPGWPDRAYREPIVVSKTPFGVFVLVSEPGAVKRVLVDHVANYPKTEMEQRFFRALFGAGLLGTDGELWRTHRRIMAPAFQPQAVSAYGPVMAATAQDFRPRWDALAASGAAVSMPEEMSALALRIISRAMFATDRADVIDPIARAMDKGFDDNNYNVLDLLPIISGMRMRQRERRMAALFRPMDDVVARLIGERAGGDAQGDLLSRLIAARDAESGAKMTPQEVRDQIVTIYIAGHETTAVAMSWIWYVLSQHPAEEAKLHAELDAILGDRAPGQGDVEQLVFTRRIVDEAMRLYPPAPGLSARAARQADELCGVAIPAGAHVLIAPWLMQRHEALWDEPERFDPDRWAPERGGNRHRFAYLPFGAGPRICIGQLMAVNEIVLILATLAQRYRMRLAPGARVGLKANVTLRPLGLEMVVAKR